MSRVSSVEAHHNILLAQDCVLLVVRVPRRDSPEVMAKAKAAAAAPAMKKGRRRAMKARKAMK